MKAQTVRTPSHYETLGVPPEAGARAIEEAFLRWGEQFRQSVVGEGAFRAAETAYRTLADPGQRALHDRRLGRVLHPAWGEPAAGPARRWHEAALRALARGRLPAARRLLAQAVRARPHDPAPRSYLALALARSGAALHEAARHGEYAVRQCPGEPAFRFNLAAVYDAADLRTRAAGVRAAGWALMLAQAIGLRRCGRRGRIGSAHPGAGQAVVGPRTGAEKRTICMKCSR
jgi:curved DNA-binding protein CbpA